MNTAASETEVTGRPPDFIIIGAMKCGTTSLHHWLGNHPDIYTSETKEIDYFIDPFFQQKDFQWYCSHFPANNKLAGESSTSYSKYPVWDFVPERIHAMLPAVKLIYSVRDPVQRIYSHFLHAVIDGLRKPDFEELYSRLYPENHLISCSRYAFQLERYLDFFPREQICVVDFNRLINEPHELLEDLFRFLGVPGGGDMAQRCQEPFIRNNMQQHLTLKSEGFPNLLEDVQQVVQAPFAEKLPLEKIPEDTLAVLKEDAARLRKLTGLSFDGWVF